MQTWEIKSCFPILNQREPSSSNPERAQIDVKVWKLKDFGEKSDFFLMKIWNWLKVILKWRKIVSLVLDRLRKKLPKGWLQAMNEFLKTSHCLMASLTLETAQKIRRVKKGWSLSTLFKIALPVCSIHKCHFPLAGFTSWISTLKKSNHSISITFFLSKMIYFFSNLRYSRHFSLKSFSVW